MLLIQMMESSRKPFKNAWKQFEIPTEAAMPCNLRTKKSCEKSLDETKRFQQHPKDKACMHRGGS